LNRNELRIFQSAHLGSIQPALTVIRLADAPAVVLAHVAASTGLADAIPEVAGYDDTTYRVRFAMLVRSYAGVAGYGREARGMAGRACIEAARTRDDLADIVNAGMRSCCAAAANCPPSARCSNSHAAPAPWSTAATTAGSPLA